MDKVVDELGLVRPNSHLVAYIPASRRALVFRVVSRYNAGYEGLNYGPLPLAAGYALPTYDGGVATIPADGVLPSRALVPRGLFFPIGSGTPLPFETTAFSNTDMWHLPADYRDRVFHIMTYVRPATIRCDIQIPPGVTQSRFQREKVSLGIEYDWGFTRGFTETVKIPGVHYGWRFGNDMNIDFHTFVRFVYGEYEVEMPKDPELVFNILNSKVPAHWVNIQVTGVMDLEFAAALREAYGFEGFPVYGLAERERALSEYRSLLGVARI